jgi:hypothetical protein
MKHPNKKEFNKLCLEFLGYKPVAGMEGMWYTHESHKLSMFSIKDFAFDTDWNQIMLVIEKIAQVYKYESTDERFDIIVNNTPPILFCTITTSKDVVVKHIHNFLLNYNKKHNGTL